MAISTQVLFDGPRNAVVKVFLTGGAGEITATAIYDASSLKGGNVNVKLCRLQGCLFGFSGKLLWKDFSGDETFLTIPENFPFDFNFFDGVMGFGGIPNVYAGGQPDGDIGLTTLGLGATDHGTIIMYVKKRGD